MSQPTPHDQVQDFYLKLVGRTIAILVIANLLFWAVILFQWIIPEAKEIEHRLTVIEERMGLANEDSRRDRP